MAKTKGSERNRVCDKCGKKLKNCTCRAKRKKTIINTGTLVLALLFIFFVGYNWYKQNEEERRKNAVQATKNLIDSYLATNVEDNWWLEKYDINQFESLHKNILSAEKKILSTLKKYKNISRQSKRIADHFTKLYLSMLNHGISVSIGIGNNASQYLVKKMKNSDIEICFIPQSESKKTYAMQYRSDWKAVLMSGIELPDPIFAGFLFHEFYHALCHIVDNFPSAMAPMGSREYIIEEVRGHDFETKIIDAATEGKYLECIDHILDRIGDADGFFDLVSQVTLDELRELDKITGTDQGGLLVKNLVISQYLFSLASKYIDASSGE